MATRAETALDPFTIEIIKDALNAIGDEMFVSLQRTSKSPIIYEVLDYCCGITDDRGQLLAQGNGVGGFLGTMAFAVQSTLEKFGRDGLQDGRHHRHQRSLLRRRNASLRRVAGDADLRGDETWSGFRRTRPTGPRSVARTPDRGRPTPSISGRKVCNSPASNCSIAVSRIRRCST